jgi:acyl-CoA synthetase (AMP-forming)/AMP-acid ligase II
MTPADYPLWKLANPQVTALVDDSGYSSLEEKPALGFVAEASLGRGGRGNLPANGVYSGLDLGQSASAVGRFLRAAGIQTGDRVALVARGGRDTVVVLLGILAAGAVAVPVNPAYQEAELEHVLRDSSARMVVESIEAAPSEALRAVVARLSLPWRRTAELVATAVSVADAGPGVVPADEDDAVIIYTSGTTGRSKGCVHTHGGLARGLSALMQLWGIGPGDVVVNALPLFHVHGLCVALLGPLWAGATVRLVDRFSPTSMLAAIDAGGTVAMTVPTMVFRLLEHLSTQPGDAARCARLRLMTCGSAALSPTQLEAFRDATGLTILERYGMSETLITLSNPLEGERIAGAVGRPVPGTSIRVVDDELQVRTPGMMRGYHNRPDADAEVFVVDDAGQRWFRTGDAVTVDDEGVVRIVGRLSQDILKVGGYKLSTREIEEALASHPDVVEVTVVGLPDEQWGQRVCAVVVPRPGARPSLPALQEHVRLAETKKPRALVLVDALPRNALGKVQKHLVTALAIERVSAAEA